MKDAAAISAEIREQVEGIFDGYGFDQGLLFGAVCAALSIEADHIATLEARVATLSAMEEAGCQLANVAYNIGLLGHITDAGLRSLRDAQLAFDAAREATR